MIENIKIKRLDHEDISDFIDLICVFEDVFEMKNFKMPDESYLQKVLKKEGFMVFTALFQNNVVGGLTAYTLDAYYSKTTYVYIFDLAVKRQFQRKGIGKMLISSINTYCESIGVDEVFVQADLADDYAIDFYRSTGGLAEDVVHFTYPLKK